MYQSLDRNVSYPLTGNRQFRICVTSKIAEPSLYHNKFENELSAEEVIFPIFTYINNKNQNIPL